MLRCLLIYLLASFVACTAQVGNSGVQHDGLGESRRDARGEDVGPGKGRSDGARDSAGSQRDAPADDAPRPDAPARVDAEVRPDGPLLPPDRGLTPDNTAPILDQGPPPPFPSIVDEAIPVVGTVALPSDAMVIDRTTATSSRWWKRWSSANGSTPYADFDNVNNKVGVHLPTNWMRDNFPLFSHIRFGNFLYGHCQSPSWAANKGLVEIVNNDLSPNFDQTIGYLRNVRAAGIRPHIALTGTPLAVAGKSWECASFGHVATFPDAALKWSWQNEVVGGLINALEGAFGKSEVQKWVFTTWTEPDCLCHFKGSYDEMADLVRMSRNILRNAAHETPLRLGNFMSPKSSDDASARWIDALLARLKASNIDFASDMNGFGLSLYQHEHRGFWISELLRAVDTAHAKAAAAAGMGLPVHIDELGYLDTMYKGDSIPTYKGDPTIYGASWTAAMVHGIATRPYTRSIAFWHRNFYLKSGSSNATTRWIKLPALNTLELLDGVRDLKQVSVSNQYVSADGKDRIGAMAGYDDVGERYAVFVFRHTRDRGNTASTNKPICFDKLANGKYGIEVYTFDRGRGSAMDNLLAGADYRSFYDAKTGNYNWQGKLQLSLAQARSYQSIDDPYLQHGAKVKVTQGRYCHTLRLPPHAVFLIKLTQEKGALSQPSLQLEGQLGLQSTTGELPIQAMGVSFDRGVDALTERPTATRYSDPGPIWKGYDEQGPGPHRAGAEHQRGIHVPGTGANLAYNARVPDLANGEIRMWIRPSWGYDASSTSNRYLLSWAPDGWKNDLRIFVWRQQHLTVRITVDGKVYGPTVKIDRWKPYQWHHLRLVFTDGHTATLEIDGKQVAEASGIPLGQLMRAGPARVHLGTTPANDDAFDGVIDEIVLR